MVLSLEILTLFFLYVYVTLFFFASRRRHTRLQGDWSSDVCSSDLPSVQGQNIFQPECAKGDAALSRSFATSEDGARPMPKAVKLKGLNHVAWRCIDEIGRASCRERV